MSRRPFNPEQATPQQDLALRAVDAARTALEKAEENLVKTMEAARSQELEGGRIPLPYLKQRAGVGRSTIYRRLSGSADDAKPDQE